MLALALCQGCGAGKTEAGNVQVIDSFFPNLEETRVGDVMAQADEQGIHLNYLYDTDHNGTGYHPIHRFDTTDFCSYSDMGEIIPFAADIEEPDIAVGTGSFIKGRDGKYHCFYTGHNDYTETFDKDVDRECLKHAVSKDNLSYKKLTKDTLRAPEGYSTNDFRDPQVLWMEDYGQYWMLVAGKRDGDSGSSILKYTSSNLSKWEFEGDFYHSDELYFMECPDLFEINGRYYLLFSWNNVTYYRMAESLDGEWITPDIDTFDGNGFYAAKSVLYEGQRYLVGFLDHKKRNSDILEYTWAGSLMPYKLTQGSDGTLGVGMPDQFENYVTGGATGHKSYDSVSTTQNEGQLPARMLLEGKVTFADGAGAAGFSFADYKLLMDADKGLIIYDAHENSQRFDFKAGETYEVRLVVENEIVVLYVNNERALSNRIYSAVGNDWQIYIDGNAVFSDINLYSMN
jgi:beta-fructofuranosidase